MKIEVDGMTWRLEKNKLGQWCAFRSNDWAEAWVSRFGLGTDINAGDVQLPVIRALLAAYDVAERIERGNAAPEATGAGRTDELAGRALALADELEKEHARVDRPWFNKADAVVALFRALELAEAEGFAIGRRDAASQPEATGAGRERTDEELEQHEKCDSGWPSAESRRRLYDLGRRDAASTPEAERILHELLVYARAVLERAIRFMQADTASTPAIEATERAARICESMVIGGRAWTEEQAVAADALLAAAKNIRDPNVFVSTPAQPAPAETTARELAAARARVDWLEAKLDRVCRAERCALCDAAITAALDAEGAP